MSVQGTAPPWAEGPPRSRRTTQRTATAIRFKPDLHDRLAAEAAARDLSINFLVNRAVTFYLERLIPADEMQWTRAEPPSWIESHQRTLANIKRDPHV